MIDACIRRMKQHRCVTTVIGGFCLMWAPIVITKNLLLLCESNAYAMEVVYPVLMSPAFQDFLLGIGAVGVCITIPAIYVLARSQPPPQT